MKYRVFIYKSDDRVWEVKASDPVEAEDKALEGDGELVVDWKDEYEIEVCEIEEDE